MAALKTYEDLIVWQKSVTLVVDIYRLTASFPAAERFGVTAQFRRAAVSVPLNIAEGFGRTTLGENLNQLSVARGSLNEIAALCTVSERLGFSSTESLRAIRGLLDEVGRMLVRMRQVLQRRQRTRR